MRVIPITGLSEGNFSVELQGRDCGDPGVSVILVEAEPGRGPSLHTHPYAEVMIVLEGTATFTDGTASREVGAGHIAVIDAGDPHAFTNTGEGVLKQIDIHVADAFRTEWIER